MTLAAESEHTVATGHPEAHPDLRPFGLITFLVSEGMLFGGLFACYLMSRAGTVEWPPEGSELELLLPTVNTLILISSSFVIHQADGAIAREDIRSTQRWLLLTFAMGAVFLGGQVYEYQHLAFGLTTNLFASGFYVLTGFHGLHVAIGLAIIAGVLLRSRQPGAFLGGKHFGVLAASIYWHFVDVVWVVLFGIVYLLQ
ncbi:MAG: heme-copper oxidase subunit III [Pseudanabaenaceae cyanobacterium]